MTPALFNLFIMEKGVVEVVVCEVDEKVGVRLLQYK